MDIPSSSSSRSSSSSSNSTSSSLNLLTLATHCIHAALLASKPIQSLQTECRVKDDGTLVTDADGAAQLIIYKQIKSYHSDIRIVGEESELEMREEGRRKSGDCEESATVGVQDDTGRSVVDDSGGGRNSRKRPRWVASNHSSSRIGGGSDTDDMATGTGTGIEHVTHRSHVISNSISSSASCSRSSGGCGVDDGDDVNNNDAADVWSSQGPVLLTQIHDIMKHHAATCSQSFEIQVSTLSSSSCCDTETTLSAKSATGATPTPTGTASTASASAIVDTHTMTHGQTDEMEKKNALPFHVDHQRVSIFVDPLDGTSSYAKGDYEAVTILIAIILDNTPVFGVIVKPFIDGAVLECFRDTGCSIIYGGLLLGGAFTIGRDGVVVELERSRKWRLQAGLNGNNDESWTAGTHALPTVMEPTDSGESSCTNSQSSIAPPVSFSSSISLAPPPRVPLPLPLSSSSLETTPPLESSLSTTTSTTKTTISTTSTATTSCPSIHASTSISTTQRQHSNTNNVSTIHVSKSHSTPPLPKTQSNLLLLRAIISKSRAGGIVQKCIDHLSAQNLLHPQPLFITGAGYKTMKLVIGHNNEGLWFFPKPGTSLWDVAAADALLRVMGGKISDRYGKELNYQKERLDAENVNGIIACSDQGLHKMCVDFYLNENWDNVAQEEEE